MSDFECLPTAARLAELEAEVERLRLATQLCDKHAPNGGTVSACVICSGQKLSYALSRISYLCEPPNEIKFSSYDLHYNEDAVVAQVERLRSLHESAVQDWRNACELMNKAEAEVERLRELGVGYSQQTMNAVVREREELRAEVERLRAQQAEPQWCFCDPTRCEGMGRCRWQAMKYVPPAQQAESMSDVKDSLTAQVEPVREWQGLTEEEIAFCRFEARVEAGPLKRDGTTTTRLARAIEAALKEKNK